MRLVLQRVKSASVSVDGAVVSSIGEGILALCGLHESDTHDDLSYCAKKLVNFTHPRRYPRSYLPRRHASSHITHIGKRAALRRACSSFDSQQYHIGKR